MPPFRILVIDDSLVIRKVLSQTLGEDADLEVAGTASDGKIGLAKIAQLKPDLITLDVEMPVMSGMEALVQVRKLYPDLPVIMFSTLTERGAAATLDALSLGASDYVMKPSNTGSMAGAIERIHEDLIPKIKSLCGKKVQKPATLSVAPPPILISRPRPAPRVRKPIHIVAIGTSTGGPNALAEVLPRIPKDFPVPIVAVQHMPPVFTKMLADRLASRSAIPIEEGVPDATLAPGRAWLAPGNFHMAVKRAGASYRLALNQEPAENSCRPAVDVLFRSVASVFGPNTLAVVMTGMGSDGLLGAQKISNCGGQIIVQDEASSVVWGMPGAIYHSGIADAAYPLAQIAGEITRRVFESRNSNQGNARSVPAETETMNAAPFQVKESS
jgi:two-component system chemotaxis response regulator CheB